MNKPTIQPWNPSAAEESSFQATDQSFDWLCQLPAGMLRQYAGKWVAVRDCGVIAAAATYDDLYRDLGAIDLQTVVIGLIERQGWKVYR